MRPNPSKHKKVIQKYETLNRPVCIDQDVERYNIHQIWLTQILGQDCWNYIYNVFLRSCLEILHGKKKTLKRAAESVIIGSGKYKFIQEIFKIRLFIL